MQISKFLFCIISIIASSWSLQAQASVSSKLQNFINSIDTKDLQGGAIAIISKGEVIYKSTFGHMTGASKPINSHTLFPLASVSKALSATAVALMVDKGAVDFNKKAPIKCLKYDVSIRNILGHTTGYNFRGDKEIEQGFTKDKICNQLKEHKPSCKPNACYFYSNSVFSLIDEALHAQGSSLATAITNLGKVLNTDEIKILPLNNLDNFAHPHRMNRNTGEITQLPIPPYYPKAATASAGIFASLDAMIEVLKLQMGHRPDLISQNRLDMLYQPYITNHDLKAWGDGWPGPGEDEMTSYYGLGFRILKLKNHTGKDFIFHSGSIAGVNSFIGFIPSEDLGIVILLNQNSNFAMSTGVALWEMTI